MSGLLDVYYPQLIQPTRHARNGHFPNHAHYAQCIAAQNHVLAYRKKEVYQRDAVLDNASSANNWRFRFRTGHGTRALRVWAMLSVTAHSPGDDPRITVEITKVGGATQSFDLHYGGAGATAFTDAPEEWSPQVVEIPVDPASAYTGFVYRSDAGRFLAMSIEELGHLTVSDSVDYYSELIPTAGAPILDGDIQTLIEGSSEMLRDNGALVAHWHQLTGAARTRSNSTPVNLIDNTTTGTPTATAAGWRFVTTARNTYSRNVVPVEFGVYASMAAGTGTVRLIDTSGNVICSISVNSSTPQWWTATGLMTVGTGQVYVPQFAGNGLSTLSVYAASLIEWES
ncbi:MAG: hypothetical protein F9K40_05315 [Kofleriaceae bacterium]|nr:MAG: hypothetical protein F9K40_05315 [Kofleriaceae bacterium]